MYEKVTVFATHTSEDGLKILLLQHPYADFQFPGGSVDTGETPAIAAIRELFEETGIKHSHIQAEIGYIDLDLPENIGVINRKTTVFSRPDEKSFDWANLPRGNEVRILRQEGKFLQITYEEGDRFPDPTYTSYQITGWISKSSLTTNQRRYLYHIVTNEKTKNQWSHFADNHTFKVFWIPINSIYEMDFYQKSWFDFALEQLKYEFI